MPTARVNDTLLSYDEFGTGRPLLLIHAGLISRSEWEFQIRAFAPTFRLIVPDLRGHGASGMGGIYSAEYFAGDLISLMNQLNIDKAVVCGHSMGGAVAQVLAAYYPKRVSAAILAETSYGVRNDPLMRFTAGATPMLARLVGVKAFLRMEARRIQANEPHIAASLQAALRAQANNPTNALKIIDAMNAFDGAGLLPRIRCPALVIVAEGNRLVRRQGEYMAQTIPNAKLVAIPNAGHGANWDNAAAFNAAVLEFLRALPA